MGHGGTASPLTLAASISQKARVLRSKSLCHDEIENILDSDHRELIGDYSKVLAGKILRLNPLLTMAATAQQLLQHLLLALEAPLLCHLHPILLYSHLDSSLGSLWSSNSTSHMDISGVSTLKNISRLKKKKQKKKSSLIFIRPCPQDWQSWGQKAGSPSLLPHFISPRKVVPCI